MLLTLLEIILSSSITEIKVISFFFNNENGQPFYMRYVLVFEAQPICLLTSNTVPYTQNEIKHLLSVRLNKLMSQQSKAYQNHASPGTVFTPYMYRHFQTKIFRMLRILMTFKEAIHI